MPLSHKEITDILGGLSAQATALTEYRQATVPLQVPLSPEMAAALGTPYRRLTPFLSVVIDVIANKLEVDDQALNAGKVKVSKELQRYLSDNSWSITEHELFQAVVRDGKAFVLTSWT